MNPDIFGRTPAAKLLLCVLIIAPSPLHHGSLTLVPLLTSPTISPTSIHQHHTLEKIKVYIGNGKGLSIQNVGSSSSHTKNASFKLNNVLHVLYMKHNLLSAFRFLKDNLCSLTLESDGPTIKDHSTGKMFLQGPIRMASTLCKALLPLMPSLQFLHWLSFVSKLL